MDPLIPGILVLGGFVALILRASRKNASQDDGSLVRGFRKRLDSLSGKGPYSKK